MSMYHGVCYRQGKNRKQCGASEKEMPKTFKRCMFYDPRNSGLPREEQFCEGCGKRYVNTMSLIRHTINCDDWIYNKMDKLREVTKLILAGEPTHG